MTPSITTAIPEKCIRKAFQYLDALKEPYGILRVANGTYIAVSDPRLKLVGLGLGSSPY